MKCALYRDLGKGPKVLEGIQVGTLYKLSISHVPTSTPEIVNSNLSAALAISSPCNTSPPDLVTSKLSGALAISSTCDTDLLLWHNRMGHVNAQVMKTMSKHNTHGTFTCVPMGKFSKIPFHVPWFIRLGRECGKSGNFAHVP